MPKTEIRCKHRHTAAEHPQCFMNGKLIDDAQWWKQVRTGYLDIEVSGFNATFGYLISWAIKDRDTGEVYSDWITRKDLSEGILDKRIVKSLLKAMSGFDCVVTYFGTRHDIPFIRTRAYQHGFQFFNMGQIKHIDLYYVVKSKLRLGRSSLENATSLFNIRGKNHVSPDKWQLAMVGHATSIAAVVDHNQRDVEILEKLHTKLETQSNFNKRSI